MMADGSRLSYERCCCSGGERLEGRCAGPGCEEISVEDCTDGVFVVTYIPSASGVLVVSVVSETLEEVFISLTVNVRKSKSSTFCRSSLYDFVILRIILPFLFFLLLSLLLFPLLYL